MRYRLYQSLRILALINNYPLLNPPAVSKYWPSRGFYSTLEYFSHDSHLVSRNSSSLFFTLYSSFQLVTPHSLPLSSGKFIGFKSANVNLAWLFLDYDKARLVRRSPTERESFFSQHKSINLKALIHRSKLSLIYISSPLRVMRKAIRSRISLFVRIAPIGGILDSALILSLISDLATLTSCSLLSLMTIDCSSSD